MNKYTKQLQAELLASPCLPLFEIVVIDNNGKTDYISCDIFFQGNSLTAQRDAVSTKEQSSKFIASTRLVVDNCFSLDEHLQELHDMVLNDISNGNLYQLGE